MTPESRQTNEGGPMSAPTDELESLQAQHGGRAGGAQQTPSQRNLPRQFFGESIVCSTNGAGTAGYPRAKR